MLNATSDHHENTGDPGVVQQGRGQQVLWDSNEVGFVIVAGAKKCVQDNISMIVEQDEKSAQDDSTRQHIVQQTKLVAQPSQ